MAVLVQTLIDQVRLLAALKNNQFYSDDEIGGFISDAGMALDDIFTDANEHYSQSFLDFTLFGGVGFNTQALPVNFERMQLLLKDPATTNPTRIDPLPNQAERGTSEGGIVPGLGRVYNLAGDVLEILPAASAAGDYRLLYTPQLGNLWPVPADTTVRLSGALTSCTSSAQTGGIKGIGATLTGTVNGALSVDGTAVAPGDRILVLNAVGVPSPTLALGIYTVTQPGAGGNPFILTRAADWDEPRELFVGESINVTAGATNAGVTLRLTAYSGGAVDVVAQTFSTTTATPPTLPTRLVPWQLFLKTHAAITVVQGRKQPMPDGLQAKFQQQMDRAVKMAKNRTEGVTQAPLQRRMGGFWTNNIPGGTW